MKHTLAPFLLTILAAPLASAQTTLAVRASDGTNLTGSYYAAAARGPGILLVHQCNMDRRAWAPLATALAAAGIHVVAPDLRGFGENKAPGQTRVPADRWGADLDVWFGELQQLPNVDTTRLAAGGASCGVVESTLLATRQHGIRALVELSGRTNLDGIAYITATPSLAIFGVAAEQDDPDGIRELVAASKHPAATAKVYAGSEHGVALLNAHTELTPAIVKWLKGVLQ